MILLKNEIDHNGGTGAQNSSGLAHGVYINASNTYYGNPTYDPNYHLLLEGNWFHDNFYGHDAKSRAQVTTALGNYFQGGRPQDSYYTTADSFNLDVPNGGVLTVKNNIFTKNASGYESAGVNLAYGEEGFPTSPYDGANNGPRSNSISIIFNTFVGFSRTIDGTHPLYPFEFLSPAQVPGAPGFPISAVTIDSNAFVGFCPLGVDAQDYRGATDLIAGFADLTKSFSFQGQWVSSDTHGVGYPSYIHQITVGKRSGQAVGGED